MSARIRFAAGALMIAGLSLVVSPLAASAHTGNLYTWAYQYDESSERSELGFATVSTTDASLTPLERVNVDVAGAEICEETGWAVGSDEGGAYVVDWDHETGAVGTPVALTADPLDFDDALSVEADEAWAADSLLDCARIAYVEFTVQFGEFDIQQVQTVSFVNADGSTVPIVFLEPDVEGDTISWMGIATDPLSGTTYLFAQIMDLPYVAVLDVDARTYGPLQVMAGAVAAFESDGFGVEADFQPDGVLWMIYGVWASETYRLVRFEPGADLVTAEPTDLGELRGDAYDAWYSGDTVLTYDPYVAVLPATGGAPLPVLAAGGLLLLAGAGVLALGTRARRTA